MMCHFNELSTQTAFWKIVTVQQNYSNCDQWECFQSLGYSCSLPLENILFSMWAIAVVPQGGGEIGLGVHFSSVRTFWKAAVLNAHFCISLYMNDYTEIFFFLPVIHETIHKKMLGLSIKNCCSLKLETNKAISLTPVINGGELALRWAVAVSLESFIGGVTRQ